MGPRAVAVVIASFFTILIAYAVRYGYGMLLPSMLPALGITGTSAGVIYSTYFLAYTLFSPLLGWLTDRYDVRIILGLFTALLGAGTLLMARAGTVTFACMAFALVGVGHAACWAPVTALVQRWVPDERRGTILSWTSMGSGIGVMTLSLVLPPLVRGFGWRAGWVAMGVTALLVAILNLVLVRRPPLGEGEGHAEESRDMSTGCNQESRGDFLEEEGPSIPHLPPNPRQPLKPLPSKPLASTAFRGAAFKRGDLLLDWTLWRIGLSYLMVGVAVLGPYTFLGTYAVDRLHQTYGDSVRIYAVIAASGMVGKLFLGHLSDRIGRIRVMGLCGLLLCVGCLGFAWAGNMIGICFSAAVFGLGFGSVWPVYAAAAPDFFPRRIAGSVIGIWTFFLGVGSIISPAVCGWAVDFTGGYGAAFLIGAAGALVSAVLLLLPMVKSRER